MPSFIFLEKLIIKDKDKALLEAKKKKGNIKLRYDLSKLKNGDIEAAIIQRKEDIKEMARTKSWFGPK